MKKPEYQIHMAAQYLAAASKNFIEPKKDDSHTNLGWNEANRSFETHRFHNGHSLSFTPETMTLGWIGDRLENLQLIGKTHKDVIDRLDAIAKRNSLNGYEFNLHYTIDSGEFNDSLIYAPLEEELSERLAHLRTISKNACKTIVSELSVGIKADVRTWPHHFDTGSYITLPNNNYNMSVGFGMAIPDSISDNYYMYCSGYDGHKSLNVSDFKKLSNGEWINGSWKGALLIIDENTSLERIVEFLREAFKAFQNSVSN